MRLCRVFGADVESERVAKTSASEKFHERGLLLPWTGSMAKNHIPWYSAGDAHSTNIPPVVS